MGIKNSIIIGFIFIIFFSHFFPGVIINISAEGTNQNESTRHSGDSIDATFGTTPAIDGEISDGEWTDANSIQFGTLNHVTIYYKQDGYGLFIGCDIKDYPLNTDGVWLALDTDHNGIATEVDYWLWVNSEGDPATLKGPDYDVIYTDYEGWEVKVNNYNYGWQVEYYITYKFINITSEIEKTLGIAFMISSDIEALIFWPSNSDINNPETYADISSSDKWGSSENILPKAIAIATPMSGEAPLNVTFTGTGTDSDGIITSYHWDFNDGLTSSEQNPTHTFQNIGTFNIILTVTDDDNAIGSDLVLITVTKSTDNVGGDDGDNQPSSDEKEKDFMPSFEFISVLCGLLIIIIISRKRFF